MRSPPYTSYAPAYNLSDHNTHLFSPKLPFKQSQPNNIFSRSFSPLFPILLFLSIFLSLPYSYSSLIITAPIFHTNPSVETGCLDFTLKWTSTTDPTDLPPKYFRIVPNEWDSDSIATYKRAHYITLSSIQDVKFDNTTEVDTAGAIINPMPVNWPLNETEIYFRIGTGLVLDRSFSKTIVDLQVTITFCIDPIDCAASPPPFIPGPVKVGSEVLRSVSLSQSVPQNVQKISQIPTPPSQTITARPDPIPPGPTTQQFSIKYYHECKYSINSSQRLHQWELPLSPLLKPGPNTSRSMFELLLKDAFQRTVVTHPKNRIDFFDLRLIGVQYFDFYIRNEVIDPDEIIKHRYCYLNQVPVKISSKSMKSREIRVFLDHSLTTQKNDIFAYLKQIVPGQINRLQLSCNQNMAIRNDFQNVASDLPLFIQITLGFVEGENLTQNLTQNSPTYALYPDRFTQFLDPAKMHLLSIPPPRVSSALTEYNPLRQVLTTQFFLEFSKTTGSMSGPVSWDTRNYLLYHTNFRLSLMLDNVIFDMNSFNPGGRTTDLRSEHGYVVLYFLPDVGYTKDDDWGPLIVLTRIYQSPSDGTPKAGFDFYAPFVPLDGDYSDGDDNGDKNGLDMLGDDLDVGQDNSSKKGKRNHRGKKRPFHPLLSNISTEKFRNEQRQLFNNGIDWEYHVDEYQTLLRDQKLSKTNPKSNSPNPTTPLTPFEANIATNNHIPPLPYQRDVPFSPYQSFQSYSDSELPYDQIPIQVVMKWYLPDVKFLDRYPQWAAAFELKHINPITMKTDVTDFELVTHFNVSSFNLTNKAYLPALTTLSLDELLKEKDGVEKNDKMDEKIEPKIESPRLSTLSSYLSLPFTPLSNNDEIEEYSLVESDLPPWSEVFEMHGICGSQKKPGFAVNIHIKQKNILGYDRYNRYRAKYGIGLINMGIRHENVDNSPSKLSSTASTPHIPYEFVWDALHASSMQGREMYYAQNVRYDRFNTTGQSVRTACLVQYLADSKKIYKFVSLSTLSNIINVVSWDYWPLPGSGEEKNGGEKINDDDEKIKKILLSTEFDSITIACPDIYYVDFKSDYSEQSSSLKKQLEEATVEIDEHFSRNNNLEQNNQQNDRNDAGKNNQNSNFPLPQTQISSLSSDLPKNSPTSGDYTCPNRSPSCKSFSSCFLYELFDPDVKGSKDQFVPIQCTQVWKSVHQDIKHIRLHATKKNDNSYLNPNVITIGTWINVLEPYEMPLWLIILIVIIGVIMSVFLALWVNKKIEKRKEVRRGKVVLLFDDDNEKELAQQLDDLYSNQDLDDGGVYAKIDDKDDGFIVMKKQKK